MHLDWNRERALEARHEVRELTQHPGWEFLTDALSRYETSLVDELLATDPTDEGAKYADLLGKINGVRSIPGIVEGIRDYADTKQAERESELVTA